MATPTSDALWLPVLPSFKDFGGMLKKETTKAGRSAGEDVAKSMADGIERSKAAVEKASEAAQKAHDRVADSAGRVRVAEERLAEVRENPRASASQIAQAEERLASERRKSEQASQAAERADDKLAGAKDKLAKAQEDATGSAADQTKATGDLQRAQEQAAQASSDLERAQDALKIGLAAAGAAAVAAGASLIKIGSDFDEAYRTIRVGTGATGEALDELQESARNVGATVPNSFGDVASTLADLNTRLGYTGEPLEHLTSQFLELENLTGTAVNIESMSGALNAFGVEADDAGGVMDDLFRVSQATGMEVNDLAEAARRGGPALREFGFGLGESAAMAGMLDKAGLDVNQTFRSMSGAMARLAEDGQDPQEAFWDTTHAIEDLIEAGDRGAAIDMAAGIFGTRGAAQFIEAVENGTFTIEDFQGAIGASDDTILGLADETRTLSEEWQIFKNQALMAIEPVATRVFNALRDGGRWLMDNVVPPAQALARWLGDNKDILIALGIALGTTLGVYAAYRGAVMGIAFATRAWNVAQMLLNGTMRLNPIGIIVTAVGLLVGALVLAYQRSETFRNIVQGAWEGIKSAVSAAWGFIQPVFEAIRSWIMDTLVPAVMGFWQDVVQPAFEGIGNVISWVWNNIIVNIFNLYVSYIRDIIAPAIMWLWNNIVQPAFEGIGNLISWAWTNVIQPVWDAMRAGLDFLGQAFTWIWENVIQPTWNAVAAIVIWLWDNVAKPMWDNTKAGLNDLGTAFRWVWENLIKPAWDAVGAIVMWLWDNVAKPYWDNMQKGLDTLGDWFSRIGSFIEDVWEKMGNAIAWVKEHIVDKAFDGIQKGLDILKGWFDTTVDAIRDTWEKIRRYVAEPINFVIREVYNQGIRRAWNAVADFIWSGDDSKQLSEVREVSLRTGGVMPGYTPGRDVHTFYSPTAGVLNLSGGEPVLRPEWTSALGGPQGVEDMNRAARTGGKAGVSKFMEQSFSGGGIMQGSITTGVQRQMWDLIRSRWGHMTLTSGTRNSNDHHGSGLAIDVSDGTDTTPAMQQIARWIHSNYGSRSLELIHWPLQGWNNIKNGAPLNYGEPTNSQHRNHVHWAMAHPPGEPGNDDEPEGGWFSGVVGAVVQTARRVAARLFDAIMDPIGRRIPDFGGTKVGELPRGAFDAFRGNARDWLLGEAEANDPGMGGEAAMGSGPVRDQVKEAMRAHGWDEGAHWNAVDFIVSRESSWNPTAQNPTSTAYGLFQFLDSTWATVGGTKTSNPYQQGVYGGRYIAQRYGNPVAARAFWERNNWYDQGGLASHIGMLLKNTNLPEQVLSPKQTEAFQSWMDAGAGGFDDRWLQWAEDAGKEIRDDFYSVIGLRNPEESPIVKAAQAITKAAADSLVNAQPADTSERGGDTFIINTVDLKKALREVSHRQDMKSRGYLPGGGR